MHSDLIKGLLTVPLGKKLHNIIKKNGGEVRIVGGAVRDLIHRSNRHPLPDHIRQEKNPRFPHLDMASTLPPHQATEILEAEGLRVIPTGLHHGTITVLDKSAPRQKIEVTTLRIDVETHGRHADVAFTDSWMADASRRDFTINAIYLGYDGRVFDPFNGIDDLTHGYVRFIGDAQQRIEEDFLRMLRFFRFNARFARTEADPDAMCAITKNAHNIARISGERIAQEMDQIMNLGFTKLCRHGLEPMIATGLDRHLAPAGFDVARLARFRTNMRPIKRRPSLASRYAALVGAEHISEFTKRLKMSNASQQTALYVASPIKNAHQWTPQNWRKYAWPYLESLPKKLPQKNTGRESQFLAEKYALSKLDSEDQASPEMIEAILQWQPPTLPIGGRDLIAAGYNRGAQIGDILALLKKHWIESDFKPKKKDLLALAQGLALDDAKKSAGEKHG